MTTGKRRHCPWALASSLGLVTAASALALGSPAGPDAAALAPPSAAVEEELYLEVLLNEVPTGQIAHFVRRGGRLHAQAQTLRSLGLVWPGADQATGLLALDSLPGLRADYEVAEQRLRLMAPVELLGAPLTLIGYAPPPAARLDPATRAAGLLLNYDLYGLGGEHSRSLGAWNELRLFGLGPGVLGSSQLMYWRHASGGVDSYSSTRLDTSWRLDFPDPMVSLVLGDSYSGALSWTRSLRFGGLRVSRNFSLQPYRVLVPLAAFAGEAALPSVVDLYINGIREAQSPVAPGRFQVVAVPVLNGAGTAEVVITDLTGQSRSLSFPLYNSSRLLQQGLGDWSLEAGKLRRHYGQRSFSYADEAMFSGSGRYGLSQRLTLEAHAEASSRLGMAGLGAQLLLGRSGGVLGASYAGSRDTGVRGHQRGLGYEWQGSGLSLNLASLRRSAGFRDVASLEGSQLPLRIEQAFAGFTIGSGQLGLSHVRQDLPNSPRVRYAGLSWSQTLGSYGFLSLGLNRALERDGGSTAYVYWTLPLGERQQAWVSAAQARSGGSLSAGASNTLAGDRDGWGWRVQATGGEQAGAQAEISQLGRYGQWRVGSQYWRHHGSDGSSTAYASASGGLLLMQGDLFAMRQVYDAFALVSTDGIAEVPVLLENRLVGTTDARGLLLVTPLNAWEDNELAIDPLGLPADVAVQQVRMAAVPATGSGVLARFPMRAMVMVELSLRGTDGAWVAPGSRLVIEPGGGSATVGYDGRLYLQDPPAGARLSLRRASAVCTLSLPAELPARGRIDLGEQTCR